MFDSVLQRGVVPNRRFGWGAVISIAVHVGVIAFAIWASARAPDKDERDVQVKFVRPPPPPPPPPPAPPKEKPKPKANEPKMVLQQAIIAPTEIPTAKPAEQEPVHGEGKFEAVDMGEVANVPDGIKGSVIDVKDVAKIPEFNETMTRPEYMSGPSPEYTQKALEREVQGDMIVRCIVTAEGRVEECHVVKSLPFMDRAVISALEKRRYKPATQGGKPITVSYVFNIRLELPQ